MPAIGSGRRFSTDTPLGRHAAEQGLRVYELSALANISPRRLTDYLNGRATPSPAHLARLSDALDVDPDELTVEVVP